MDSVKRDIFRAIHEGKWLSIEYVNQSGDQTRYWIGIEGIDLRHKSLCVSGLHLGLHTVKNLYINPCNIISSAVIDGTYQPVNTALINDIHENPEKYESIFSNTANLKILNYLADCSKLDTLPYQSQYTLIEHIDNENLTPEGYALSEMQFNEIVGKFQKKFAGGKKFRNVQQLCMNLLSIHTPKGLYVLAYKRLELNVKRRTLRPVEDITICKEFTINGEKLSIRKFLDGEDIFLLDDFQANAEIIKDIIMRSSDALCVDDMPYLINIESSPALDPTPEYNAILDMYEQGSVTVPIKAFFGDLTVPSRRRKDYPMALVSKMNLDQLLSVHNAMKYPIAYIQGPPGTGKTSTIINTITTAFFNEKTVLFSSYNNHPIDGVFKSLSSFEYDGKIIPFPILRLGNQKLVDEALDYINRLFELCREIEIDEKELSGIKKNRSADTRRLTELLKKHEERIELNERKDAIENLLKLSDNMTYQADLQARQLNDVNVRLEKIETVTDEDISELITDDTEALRRYLYYNSVKYIQKLKEPKYDDLAYIISMTSRSDRAAAFDKYLSEEENLLKLMKVFPIIATTCISAHKLGEPKPYFDMVIIDEASQCNTAMSLVPIVRGKNLMLVGDPQQLSPVVVLDPNNNKVLRKKYKISDEYDYIENSVYKTYLACDAVSNEILLSYHYRCAREIIEFNNKKYYNSRLNIKTCQSAENPLVFDDIQNDTATFKNTAPAEADRIIQYAKEHTEKSIGVITPFANQKSYIEKRLRDENLSHVSCGTVHAFQGDEKDIVLFSLALTDKTHPKTYEWLKNNRELVNVAVSRAKKKLVILSSRKELERLHQPNSEDDIYDLVTYVQTNGVSAVTPRNVSSRALGIKPYSTETEEAFLDNLSHALGNILYSDGKCSVRREVAISQVFSENEPYSELFYTGRFDFVIYERDYNNQNIPILAIELDGKEHMEDEFVRIRDKKKNKICRDHGFELIRVDNSYARRYNHIKEILIDYFSKSRR